MRFHYEFCWFSTPHDILKEGGIVSSLSFLTDDMEIHLHVRLHLLKLWENIFQTVREDIVLLSVIRALFYNLEADST